MDFIGTVWRSRSILIALAVCCFCASTPSVVIASDRPTMAVLDFSTQGLTSDWYGNFQPGVALADLVTDNLVNGGQFNIVDRTHIDSVMQEHQLSTNGEVAPATYVQSGQLTGARYLITGDILQFEQTGESGAGGGAGGLLGGAIGGVLGSVHTQKVTLKVQVRVIDAVTGEIVQSFADEQSKSATSWGAGGGAATWRALGAGGYSNTQFMSSTMGHLINDEAAIIANHLDPSKFPAARESASSVHGRILTVDGADIVLNIGSDKGVSVGMMMSVISVRQLKDPDSGKMITTEIPKGVIQVVSVSKASSVARLISGTASALQLVRSQ
jgi:curli biogenesis system outer membrane secretion channel CsgG